MSIINKLHDKLHELSAEEFDRQISDLGVRLPSSDQRRQLNQILCQDREVISGLDWISPITLSGPYEVFDFSKKYDANRKLRYAYGWGRFDEDRVGMYEAELFHQGPEPRTVHMGVDLGAPAGTCVFAPMDARVFGSDYRASAGDYGGTVILVTKTPQLPLPLYMLFGHLSRMSLRLLLQRSEIQAGQLIGWLGERFENGGWNPHLHFQMSWLEPREVDLPGAVSLSKREIAKSIFPDPTELLQRARAGWPKSVAVLP